MPQIFTIILVLVGAVAVLAVVFWLMMKKMPELGIQVKKLNK